MRRVVIGMVLGVSLTWSGMGTATAQDAANQPIWSAGEVSLSGGPAQQQAHQEFTLNGTMLRIVHTANADEARLAFLNGNTDVLRAATDPAAKPYGLLKTNDATGSEAYIVLDLSWLDDDTDYINLDTGEQLGGEGPAVMLLVRQQPDNTFLAIQYQALAKGNAVNNTDFGVQERMTVRDDAINASGVCDDDENCKFFDEQEDDDE